MKQIIKLEDIRNIYKNNGNEHMLKAIDQMRLKHSEEEIVAVFTGGFKERPVSESTISNIGHEVSCPTDSGLRTS